VLKCALIHSRQFGVVQSYFFEKHCLGDLDISFSNVLTVLTEAGFTFLASPKVETWGYPVLKCVLFRLKFLRQYCLRQISTHAKKRFTVLRTTLILVILNVQDVQKAMYDRRKYYRSNTQKSDSAVECIERRKQLCFLCCHFNHRPHSR
jgi:hypothetical protein